MGLPTRPCLQDCLQVLLSPIMGDYFLQAALWIAVVGSQYSGWYSELNITLATIFVCKFAFAWCHRSVLERPSLSTMEIYEPSMIVFIRFACSEHKIRYRKKIYVWLYVSNDFFGHSWSDSPMIFTWLQTIHVTANHWRIASITTPKNRYSW